ncbi:MAG TPA: aldo/keto reductase [Thermoleophilaceae bacterium]|nr:aldo/keto reductase [Thermoleophilaceae bacterium]
MLRLPAGPGEKTPHRFGLGLAALGRPGYINLGHGDDLGPDRSPAVLERYAHAMLDAAYERGIRYFDAARSYGRAEEFLGDWLRAREPADVVVGSKWGYVYTAGWEVDADPPEVKHHDAETFRRQLEETRANLGSYLSLYQIHSATPESGVLGNEEVLAELRALREEGVALGVSVSGTSQSESIDRARELGVFDAVQATWNLHERAAEDALAAAHEAGMAVLVKEAVANGRLTPRGGNDRLEQVAAELGVPSDALALAAVLARPWADIVLSGAATSDVLDSNLRALEVDWSPELESRLAWLAEPSKRYWAERASLKWN